MLDDLTYASFAPLEGEPFQVQLDADDTLELTLASATLLSAQRSGTAPSPSSRQGESFSLVFHGPRARFLPQATYQVTHARLGDFPLFLVPIGADEEHFRYEAVFNRLAPRPASTP
jgi:hypothetical protein